MVVIEPVGSRHIPLVPGSIPCLVAAEQQDGSPPRIKCIEDAVGPAFVLDTQLPHALVPGRPDVRGEGKPEPDTLLCEKVNDRVDAHSLIVRQVLIPDLELARGLDFAHGNIGII